jgi:hypothetical protein
MTSLSVHMKLVVARGHADDAAGAMMGRGRRCELAGRVFC